MPTVYASIPENWNFEEGEPPPALAVFPVVALA
jgi:hypothetical protein